MALSRPRVTSNSSTLIDLCVTNIATKIVNSGALHLGITISDQFAHLYDV